MSKKYNAVDINGIHSAFRELYKGLEFEVDKRVAKAVNEEAFEGRKFIKDETIAFYGKKNFVRYHPKKYQNCFRTKRIDAFTRRIKNTEYRLSHLLENGHMVANQYGENYNIKNSEYGTKGYKTISFEVWKKTEEKIAEELPNRIKKTMNDL